MQTFSLCLATQYGQLPEIRVDVPDIPVDIAEFIPLMQGICDTMVRQAIASLGEDEQVTCRQGCGACCHQAIPLSIPETLYLTRYLTTLPKERYQVIQQRLHTAREQCEEAGLYDALFSAQTDEEANEAAKEYIIRGIRCPFFEEGACSIYSIRPFVCREFNVQTPPEWCSDPFHYNVKKVPIAPRITTIMARFAAQVLKMETAILPLISIGQDIVGESQWWRQSSGTELFKILMGTLTPVPVNSAQKD